MPFITPFTVTSAAAAYLQRQLRAWTKENTQKNYYLQEQIWKYLPEKVQRSNPFFLLSDKLTLAIQV